MCPSTGKVLWERAFALNDTSFYPMKLVTLLRGTGHQLPALPSPVMDPPFLVFEGIAQVRPALGVSLLIVVISYECFNIMPREGPLNSTCVEWTACPVTVLLEPCHTWDRLGPQICRS